MNSEAARKNNEAARKNNEEVRIDKSQNILTVVALFIATISSTLVYHPLGGVRDISSDPFPPTKVGDNQRNEPLHCGGSGIYLDLCPGEAIAGVFRYDFYEDFMVNNTICLISSVSVVAIVVGGVPLNKYGLRFLRFLMVLALVTFVSTGITAMEMLKPRQL
ncbi:hypothetical protein QL285_020113 [Trifolium repens]|nr:hypothetical protein QL285_020113 [Trifolium repens]